MAVTPVLNFQPIMNDPFSNMFKTGTDVYSGMKQGQLNNLMAQKQRQMMPFYLKEADLTNKLNEYKLQQEEAKAPYYEQFAKGDLQKLLMYPDMIQNQKNRIGPGIAGQYKELEKAEAEGNWAKAGTIRRGIESTIGSRTTLEERNLGKLPVGVRGNIAAKGAQLKVDPLETFNRLSKGESLNDIAATKNVNPEELATMIGYYPPTGAVVTQSGKRAATDAELEFLNDRITEWRKPYKGISSDLTGVSAQYIADLMSGKNQKEREQLIAAYILSLDVPAGSLRLASIEGGITALQAQMEHQLADIKPILAGKDPDAWDNGTRLAMDTLSAGNTIYYDVAMNPGPFIQGRKEKYGIKSGEIHDKNKELVDSVAKTKRTITRDQLTTQMVKDLGLTKQQLLEIREKGKIEL